LRRLQGVELKLVRLHSDLGNHRRGAEEGCTSRDQFTSARVITTAQGLGNAAGYIRQAGAATIPAIAFGRTLGPAADSEQGRIAKLYKVGGCVGITEEDVAEPAHRPFLLKTCGGPRH
jgi:hypothetical protein